MGVRFRRSLAGAAFAAALAASAQNGDPLSAEFEELAEDVVSQLYQTASEGVVAVRRAWTEVHGKRLASCDALSLGLARGLRDELVKTLTRFRSPGKSFTVEIREPDDPAPLEVTITWEADRRNGVDVLGVRIDALQDGRSFFTGADFQVPIEELSGKRRDCVYRFEYDERDVSVANPSRPVSLYAEPNFDSKRVDTKREGVLHVMGDLDVVGRDEVWQVVANEDGYLFARGLAASEPDCWAEAVRRLRSETSPNISVCWDRLRSGDRGPEMVVIPAGRFEMGCDAEDCNDNEKPVHDVRIGEDFALGRYEVTVGEFRSFVQATGYRTEAEKNAGQGCRTSEIMDRNKWDWTPGRSWRNLEYAVQDRQPVTCVSWNDAKAYVAWLADRTDVGYRLPSESEWEYAVRAGTRTRYHFGHEAERLCTYGNVADETKLPNGSVWTDAAECEDGAVFPTSVGSYRPNAFGLYDMHGNVWEWTEDCWNRSYRGAPTNGSAWLTGNCSLRVLRGGSWGSYPRNLRAAVRYTFTTDFRTPRSGFRVARTLIP